MNTKSSSSPWPLMAVLFAALCAFVLFASITTPASAQVIPSDLSALDSQLSASGQPAAPWYLSTEFFAALFSAVAGIVAVIQSQGKTKAQKINEALVIGIEAATKIPAVAAGEKRIKTAIRNKAEELGVQPVLHRLVKDLTY